MTDLFRTGWRSFSSGLVVLAFTMALQLNGRIATADGKPAELTLQQIYDGARLARQKMQNMRVDYQMTTRPLAKRPPAADKGAVAVIGICRRTFVFEGERRYSSQAWDTGKGFVEEPTYVFDGSAGFFCRPGRVMINDGKDPSTDKGEYYCEEMLEFPIADDIRANYDNSWFYPHCLRSGIRTDLIVLPEQEQVDGAWCHVVQCADVQKLWVDPQIGFAVRRKERHKPGSARDDFNDGKPLPLADYKFSNFSEAVPGLWLPLHCERITYPATAKSLEPELELVLDVTSLDVNTVSDRDFEIELPAGTMVVGKTIGFVTRGDKTKLLDVVAGKLSKKSGSNERIWIWLIVINAVLIGLALAFLQWRRSARRQLSPLPVD